MKGVGAAVLLVVGLGCSSSRDRGPDAGASTSASAAPPLAPAAPAKTRAALVHEGGALSRGPFEEALYLADEDQGVLRRIPLPVDPAKLGTRVEMPGAPAQVLALDGRVLVTVRNPGLLLVLRPDDHGGLTELGRVALPADAWGLAVTPDERTALVSSAWTHKLSAIDLATLTVRWTVDLAREPRAVVVRPDGDSAYVTHLVGTALTRLDGLGGAAPTIKRLAFPPAPLSSPLPSRDHVTTLDASLAYSAVLLPGEGKLFVPRHALGAYGKMAWFGRAVVDVLRTSDDAVYGPGRITKRVDWGIDQEDHTQVSDGSVPTIYEPPFTQPRAVAFRRATGTLLVLGEGDERLAELDPRGLDPAIKALRIYALGGKIEDDHPGATRCGAPTGLALSADEATAYVFCRSTDDLATVKLDTYDPAHPFNEGLKPGEAAPIPTVHLGDDPLKERAALGRRLFYSSRDIRISEGLGCAGCHPDGRDDGHVWHEHDITETFSETTMHHVALAAGDLPSERELKYGLPRQTPMLAGRPLGRGPFGWHGGTKTLEERLILGFALHRWLGSYEFDFKAMPRAEAIADFVRTGLVAPPREARALTPVEDRGREVFLSNETRCGSCHFPDGSYTDHSVVELGRRKAPKGFLDEKDNLRFKTPSLLFVAGTPPYFHDGATATLEDLVEKNHDRMGKTDQLSADDKKALVAYLATIGAVKEAGAVSPDPKDAGSPAAPGPLPTFNPPEPAAVWTWPASLRSAFEIDPPEEARSPAPSDAEWKKAGEIHFARSPRQCTTRRLREWLRVSCDFTARSEDGNEHIIRAMKVLAGPEEGVTFVHDDGSKFYEIIVPVRRGERRVLEMDFVALWTRYTVHHGVCALLSIDWPVSEKAPVVILD